MRNIQKIINKAFLQFIIFQLFCIQQIKSQIFIGQIRVTEPVINATTSYAFTFNRFSSSEIPAGSTIKISFPGEYSGLSPTSYTPIAWTNASSISGSVSDTQITLANGFPNNISLTSFSVNISGIINPIPAGQYGQFTVVIVFPNGTNETDGGGGNSVSLTPASAICNLALFNAFVNQQGFVQITYTSKYVPLLGGSNLRVRIPTFYDQNPSRNINVSISNSGQTTPPFQFAFTNIFNISLLMPPSNKPQTNFIEIQTFNANGIYDFCQVTINGIQPNNFNSLSISKAQVQSVTNLTFSMSPKAPLLQTDTVKLQFSGNSGDFNLSGLANQAQFTSGFIGTKSLVKSGNIISINSVVATPLINGELIFILKNITLPFSTRPTTIKFTILTNLSYIRDERVYTYTANAGNLPSIIVTCDTYEIGYQTFCVFDVTLKNYIQSNGVIQISLPTGFTLTQNSLTCPSEGNLVGINSNCQFISANNTIEISGMTASNQNVRFVPIKITVPIKIPTQIKTFSINLRTKSLSNVVDSGTTSITSTNRAFLQSQVTITSSQQLTLTQTNYTVNLALPLNLGITYLVQIYLPFETQGTIVVNNGISAIYNSSKQILQIANVSKNSNNGNITLQIQGFFTFQSTQPKTIYGNLLNSGVRYFYFASQSINVGTPRAMAFNNTSKTSNKVGQSVIVTFTMSDIKNGDKIQFTQGYSINQSGCSTNVVSCSTNRTVTVLNNFTISNPFVFNVQMINLNYVGAIYSSFLVKDSTGVFEKQRGYYIHGASDPNQINVTYTQTNPYYQQNTTYTFQISLTTSGATNLIIQIPSSFSNIYSTQCISGCTQPSSISNSLNYIISTNIIRLSIFVQNPSQFDNNWAFRSFSGLGTNDLLNTFKPIYPCTMPCRSCLLNSTSTCTTCYLWNTYDKLRNGLCVQNCQPAQFINSNRQCKACNTNCSSCVGTSTNCTGCINAITFVLHQSKCITGCPYGYFKDSTLVQPICRLCNFSNPNCIECSSISLCLDCDTTTLLFQGSCLSSCIGGYYALDGKCISCSPANKPNICTGCQSSQISPNFGTCTSCIQDYFIQNRSCVPECSQGLFKGATKCEPCVFPCLTCQNNSFSCKSCQLRNNITGTKYYLLGTVCRPDNCPNLYYISFNNNVCVKCQENRNCQNCNATHCLTCKPSYFFYLGSCLLTCPIGTFKNSNGIDCSPCISTCEQCQNSASYCTKCAQSYIFHVINNSCLLTCPNTYFNLSSLCQKCVSPCSNCLSLSICTSCQNLNWKIQQQTCVQNCSNPYYLSSTNFRLCQTCRQPCDTCDIFSNNCTSCLAGYAFYNQTCSRTCPEGYYFIDDSCVQCPDLCQTCLLFGQEIRCTLCSANATFYGYVCVSDCPVSSRPQDPYCISDSCQGISNCEVCSHLRCLQCSQQFTLNNASQCQNNTNGAVLNSISQIPVPFPFLIILIILLVSGFIMKFQFSKMYVPVFIYSFGGLLQIGSIVLWSTLAYLEMNQLFMQSAEDSKTGQGKIQIILLIPFGLLALYLVFNLINSILFCVYICSDRLFKNWLNQGNLCSVFSICILGFIFSFRFIALMFSRLAHRQFFSAVISNHKRYMPSNVLCILSIFILDVPCIVIAGIVAYNQTKQNYLFFSSLEVAAVCLIMIIIDILYLLIPSDYSLRKKQEYQQGIDQDEGRSVEEIMIGMGVVQQQYNQGKSIKQEQHEDQRQNLSVTNNEPDQNQSYSFQGESSNPLTLAGNIYNFGTRLKETSGLQLDDQQDYAFRQKRQAKQKQIAEEMERQQQQNNRRQIEKLAREIDLQSPVFQPSRPVGSIIKQLIGQYDDSFQDQYEEQIQQQDSIYDRVLTTENTVGMQQQIEFKLKKEKQQALQIKRKQMQKINKLLEQLRERQQQELQLKCKMKTLMDQQNMIKNREYERARQVMQRNQMGVQDKLSQLSEMFRARNQRQKKRKSKIQELQRQKRSARKRTDQIRLKEMIYPKIEEQVAQSNLKQIEIPNPVQLQEDIVWPERQQKVSFESPSKKWKFADQQNQEKQEDIIFQPISEKNSMNGPISRRTKSKSKQPSMKNQSQKQLSARKSQFGWTQKNALTERKSLSQQLSARSQNKGMTNLSSRINVETDVIQVSSRNRIQDSDMVEASGRNIKQNSDMVGRISRNINQGSDMTRRSNYNRRQGSDMIEKSSLTHWPIDPQLEQQILEVQKRANKYLQNSRQSIPNNYFSNDYDKQEIVSDLNSQVGDGSNFTEAIIYQQDEQQQDQQQVSQQSSKVLQIQAEMRMPKGRVNRKVFDLSTNRK